MSIARELMISPTPSIDFDATVIEAIQKLKNFGTNFIAVKADDNRYQGVLTEGNLVRIFIRSQAQSEDAPLILFRDYFEPMQLIQEQEEFPEIVKKIMTAVGNRVFVIDDKGSISGYISAKDILPSFLKMGVHGSEQRSVTPPTKNKAPMEALKSELFLYESFFEKSPFMMHSVNPDGEIQMANEMLHAVLGYDYGELIGKTIFDLYPKANHKKAEAGIKTILNKGFHSVVQAEMLTKTNQVLDVELASRALTDEKGKPVGTITVSRPLKMDFLLQGLKL